MNEELQELKERAEQAREDRSLAPVTVTMAMLAVLVAIVTLLDHRAHTEELLLQNKSTDQWAYYQAKSIRRHSYEMFLDLFSISSPKDPAAAEKLKGKYSAQVERYKDEQKEIEAEARKLEQEVSKEGGKAARFGLGEVLLEVALVVTSITLLTRQKAYWIFGLGLAAAGLVIAALGLLIH
jgi:hypothetical protein